MNNSLKINNIQFFLQKNYKNIKVVIYLILFFKNLKITINKTRQLLTTHFCKYFYSFNKNNTIQLTKW